MHKERTIHSSLMEAVLITWMQLSVVVTATLMPENAKAEELFVKKEMGQPRRGMNDLLPPVLMEVFTLCHTTSTPSLPPEYRVTPSAVNERQCTVSAKKIRDRNKIVSFKKMLNK